MKFRLHQPVAVIATQKLVTLESPRIFPSNSWNDGYTC